MSEEEWPESYRQAIIGYQLMLDQIREATGTAGATKHDAPTDLRPLAHVVADMRTKLTEFEKITEQMRELLSTQGASGNWDYDPYMQGMYNGMELVLAAFEGRDPVFRSAPDHWRREGAQSTVTDEIIAVGDQLIQVTDFQGRIWHRHADKLWYIDGPYLMINGVGVSRAQWWWLTAYRAPLVSSGPHVVTTTNVSTINHRYTHHGHPCCRRAAGDRPEAIARCGGAPMCAKCQTDVELIHRGE